MTRVSASWLAELQLRDRARDAPTFRNEAEFQSAIVKLATRHGWHHFHVHDSRRSKEGWPDLVLAHEPTGRLLFRELKNTGGTLTGPQKAWIARLRLGGCDAGAWWPSDWSEIHATLTGKERDEW